MSSSSSSSSSGSGKQRRGYRGAFKASHPPCERKNESERIRNKYPDSIPLICEYSGSGALDPADKIKYLVPRDFTSAQFMYILRKRLTLDPSKALFLFYGESTLAAATDTMARIYEAHADEDGFLYAQYSGENTFGGGDGGCGLPRSFGSRRRFSSDRGKIKSTTML